MDDEVGVLVVEAADERWLVAHVSSGTHAPDCMADTVESAVLYMPLVVVGAVVAAAAAAAAVLSSGTHR
jgi:hypothetical protein